MLVGTVVHDLLQTVIKKDLRISFESVTKELDTLIKKPNYILLMWVNEVSVFNLKSEVEKYIQNVIDFASGIKINDRKLLVI